MASNLARYKDELEQLLARAQGMLVDLLAGQLTRQSGKKDKNAELFKDKRIPFSTSYQRWYTEATAVIRQLIPDRLPEFETYYRSDPKRKAVNDLTYRIQDWVNGFHAATNSFNGEKYFNDEAIVSMAFQTQIAILESAAARFESALLDITAVLQSDLFDSELAAARELLAKGFVRAAGVLAGVVLERHLLEVCNRHQIAIRKKQPGVGDLNEMLKGNDTIDVPTWRFIQRLGDIRNLCAHNKEREPTLEDAREMLDGVERVTKTVY